MNKLEGLDAKEVIDCIFFSEEYNTILEKLPYEILIKQIKLLDEEYALKIKTLIINIITTVTNISIFEQELFNSLQKITTHYHIEAYIVGGYVREKILNNNDNGGDNNANDNNNNILGLGNIPDIDIDIVVVGDAMGFCDILIQYPKFKNIVKFENYGTAKLQYITIINSQKIIFDIDIVSTRQEKYISDSRNPIVQHSNLITDLYRRDFTINTIIMTFGGEIIDLLNGYQDIESKIITTPLDPDQTFQDDPLRMIRAIRFSAKLSFTIAPETWQGIINNKSRIKIITMERFTAEFNKILCCNSPGYGLKLLVTSGIITELLVNNGVTNTDINFKKLSIITFPLLNSQDICKSSNLYLKWTAFLIDCENFKTKHGNGIYLKFDSVFINKFFTIMKLPLNKSRSIYTYVSKMFTWFQSIINSIILVPKSSNFKAFARRLLYEMSSYLEIFPEIIPELKLLLTNAVELYSNKNSLYRNNMQIFYDNITYLQQHEPWLNTKSVILSGKDIINISGEPPGKNIGVLKKTVEDAVLDGLIPNDYNAKKEYLQKILKNLII